MSASQCEMWYENPSQTKSIIKHLVRTKQGVDETSKLNAGLSAVEVTFNLNDKECVTKTVTSIFTYLTDTSVQHALHARVAS